MVVEQLLNVRNTEVLHTKLPLTIRLDINRVCSGAYSREVPHDDDMGIRGGTDPCSDEDEEGKNTSHLTSGKKRFSFILLICAPSAPSTPAKSLSKVGGAVKNLLLVRNWG